MSEEPKKKPKRPTPAQYNKEEIALAMSLADIKPCRDCGWPVLNGYCCQTCGSASP